MIKPMLICAAITTAALTENTAVQAGLVIVFLGATWWLSSRIQSFHDNIKELQKITGQLRNEVDQMKTYSCKIEDCTSRLR